MTPYPRVVEQTMRTSFESLRENDRRRYAAVEAAKLGHGGIEVLRGPHRAAERLSSAVHGAVDRQRDGGGCGQDLGRPPSQADGSPVAGRERQPDGRTVLSDVQRSLG